MEFSSNLEILTQEPVFPVLMEDHEHLYLKALKNGQTFPSNSIEHSEFVKEIDALLVRIHHAAEGTKSWDEYKWLTDAIFKWQVIFASTLNIPRTIDIPDPPKDLLPTLPPEHALTEAEICYLVDRNSKYLETMQELQEGSPLGINQDDIHKQAEIYLASDILDGKINFASRISSDSYWRLERIWLDDIKRLMAYFLWKLRGGGIDEKSAIEDFLQTSAHIRGLLDNIGMKAKTSEFGEAKAYIENKYLINGKINFRNPEVKILIARKAEQIREKNNLTDDVQNWIRAESYVQMFYENIIPAVIENDLEKILIVLKSFQCSDEMSYSHHIINAFEVALVIYFLDEKTIQEIWKRSTQRPQSQLTPEGEVCLELPFDAFKVHKSFDKHLRISGGNIFYKGVMTVAEKESIQKTLSSPKHAEIIEQLFNTSRLIHKHTTL